MYHDVNVALVGQCAFSYVRYYYLLQKSLHSLRSQSGGCLIGARLLTFGAVIINNISIWVNEASSYD